MEENLKQKTKLGLYWKLFDQSATQIMQFVVGVVMARLLSPEDYGITALPAVFMAVAGIFIDGSFSAALVRKPNVTEKDLATSFYYSIGVGLFMYLCLFISAPWIADFYDTPVLTSLIRITALSFLWGPLGTPQNVILNKRLDFKTPARISVINKIISAILGISIAYAGYGLWALVISGLSSSLLGLLQTWWVVKWIPKEKFSKESFKYLWNFGNKMIGANLIDTIYNNVTPIFVGKYYSPKDLGIYNRALGYVVLPANQITGLLTSVTFPVLSKMQDDRGQLAFNYRRMIKVTAFISFPIFMILCALAKPVVLTLITEKWISCVLLLQIMCFAKMWWPIQVINRNLMQVVGRSDLYLRVEVIKKSINFLLLCCSLPFGIDIFCYCQILQTALSMFINTYYTKELIDFGFWKQIRDVCPMFCLSFVSLGASVMCVYFIDNEICQIVFGGLLGLGIYFSLSYVLKMSELRDLLYLLKTKRVK